MPMVFYYPLWLRLGYALNTLNDMSLITMGQLLIDVNDAMSTFAVSSVENNSIITGETGEWNSKKDGRMEACLVRRSELGYRCLCS